MRFIRLKKTVYQKTNILSVRHAVVCTVEVYRAGDQNIGAIAIVLGSKGKSTR